MELTVIERDRHDHPDFDPLLPHVGCAVCGRAVQTVARKGEFHLAYQAAPDDEEAQQLRGVFEAPMADWSRKHGMTHSAEEHQQAQDRQA